MNTNEILEKLGIEMNAMQNEAYDAILHSRNDVVVLSPTGSGKTLAYLMPLVQLVDADSDEVQAVVITPGRELALQSAEVLKSMGSGLRGMACYGGRPTMDEHRVLRQVKPQIIFGTPGRLNDHLEKRNILADDIKYLVIDEFDKCLEMGFQDEMSALIDKVQNVDRHFLLSATKAEEIPHFLRRDKKAKVTNISYLDSEEQVPDRIGIYQVNSPEKDKLESLKQLLLSLGDQSTIVFLNYRQSVERVDDFLRQQSSQMVRLMCL